MQDALLVPLDADHPGFRDPAYRARRNEIARQADAHAPGSPVAPVLYTEDENRLWERLNSSLRRLWRRRACRQILDCVGELPIPGQRVPQLEEVNALLAHRGGFRMEPVAGLIEPRVFLGELGHRRFLSTQYIRHVSKPLYTPEPDVVHELLGHAASLAQPRVAELSQAFGRATIDAAPQRVAQLERLYWYTLEYGLVREGGAVKALGAGILSSVGEIRRSADGPQLLDFDPERCARTDYDPTHYQPQLFVAESFDALVDRCLEWLSGSG